MTHGSVDPRSIRLEALARIEGEASLQLEIEDGRLRHAHLHIFEPPRFFEALLRGLPHTDPPDVTARICGICPVAYQMSACAAIEAACGVTVDGPIADLRRLIYCGEWISSHALHVHLLHAPDFLGYDGVVQMAADHQAEVERGLALKKTGNALLELVGGRAIHPINVRVGGFHRAPTVAELRAFAPRLEAARDAAVATVAWVAGFDFPDVEGDWELLALRPPDGYPIIGGRAVSTDGLDLGPDEFDEALVEEHAARSTALRGSVGERVHLLGPLARFVLNGERLAPAAAEAARSAGLAPSTRNPFRTIVVRAVEIVHACEEALSIIEGYEPPDRPFVDVPARAGVGTGWTEAPRGMLWHRYELAADGTIASARIAPPTAHNQAAIEQDVFRFVSARLDRPDEELALEAERAIRNHDPCISCATHFLDVTVTRR